MGHLLDKISKESIVKIAEAHVTRFSNMLYAASVSERTNVNVPECQMYKDLWGEVVTSKGENLSKAARCELMDALFDGSYLELLTEEERKLLEGDEEEYDEE